MLGLSGWKSRLCTLAFGLCLYLTISTLISTRKLLSFSTHPSSMFESAQEALFSGSARGLAQDGQQTPQYHYHHPRNLAAAAAASMNNRPSLQRTNHRNRGGPQLGNIQGQNWTKLTQIGPNWTLIRPN